MKTIYFAGHDSFGNRGCEALVRSTVMLVRANLGTDFLFLVPSRHNELDRQQWPDHEQWGVEFVTAPSIPKVVQYWCSALSRTHVFDGLKPPVPKFSKEIEDDIRRSDAVLMIGGDILSTDYGTHSLYFWTSLVERARQLRVPTFLWAASVGPFGNNHLIERAMVQHLKGYQGISVRETSSADYLLEIAKLHVCVAADPAFHLLSEEPDLEDIGDVFFDDDVLGFNVSPLIARFQSKKIGGGEEIDQACSAFIRWVLEKTSYSVLLTYHVDPFSGSGNSDYHYMKKLMSTIPSSPRLKLLNQGLNASQLKGVIKRFRFFIGARTHATIAALSMEVPTVSIAYSIKARAINNELFGSQDFVLETPDLSMASLTSSLMLLESRENEIRDLLFTSLERVRERSVKSVYELEKVFHNNLCQESE